ncbi:MAG: hypothetical protein HY754_09160 [Nitrospirae bacterium]|nr:hypothetical protein [Nitrospirota bacterium]
MAKHLSKHIRTYDPRIFMCYDSYISRDIKELKVMTHSNIFKHPVFYAIPVMIVVFIIMFMKSGFSRGEIIPGSHHAKKLTEKKNFLPVSTPVNSVQSNRPKRFPAVVVEYKDLMKRVNERKERDEMKGLQGSQGVRHSSLPRLNMHGDRWDMPVQPITQGVPVSSVIMSKKVGNVVVYDGNDQVISSKDVIAKLNKSDRPVPAAGIPHSVNIPSSQSVPVR